MNEGFRQLLFAALVVLSVSTAGADSLPADVRAALHAPAHFTLYSITPSTRREGTGFHSFGILGSVAITDTATRERIAATLEQHIRIGGPQRYCFNPRHGIRLVAQGVTHDLVICYECGKVQIYSTGQSVRSVGIGGSTRYLDFFLRSAKIPLAQHEY